MSGKALSRSRQAGDSQAFPQAEPRNGSPVGRSNRSGDQLIYSMLLAGQQAGDPLTLTAERVVDALTAQHASSREVIQAAQAVVARWDSPLWRQEVHTAELINDLRDAIAPQLVPPECTRSHPHEGMNAACQEKSIQAQATNAAANAASAAESQTEQQAELLHRLTESRQRQDAMRIGLELIALGEAPDAMTCAVDALVIAGMWNPDEESRARAAIAAERAVADSAEGAAGE